MALTQVVENGKLVDTSASSTSSSSTSSSSSTDLDKEAFLQLLVAQMKYQDPLEPTSNTEYVAQLATFSQLEATQNLEESVESSTANDLVGKYVILKVTNSTTGNTSYVNGMVDYVMYENGNTYLSVNDSLYSIDDLDTVVNSDYFEASNIANTFATMMEALPSVSSLTTADASDVQAARDVYDSMTDYQKTFVDEDYVTKLEELENRIASLTSSSTSTSS